MGGVLLCPSRALEGCDDKYGASLPEHMEHFRVRLGIRDADIDEEWRLGRYPRELQIDQPVNGADDGW